MKLIASLAALCIMSTAVLQANEKTNSQITTPATCKPVSGNITYIHLNSGGVEAFPQAYVSHISNDGTSIVITDKRGTQYRYSTSDVTMNEEKPTNQPTITSFKFNNKFNDMLIVDAEGKIEGDSTITIAAGGIGKRLVPSFQMSEDNALVYIGKEKQTSKQSSQRYESPLTYTVARPGHTMLREMTDGTYAMCPFGRDYKVSVDYLCDHPTTEYGVPVIYVTTDDGTMITSRDYYWTGKIKIDGAGFLPDLKETTMNIKGRGNTSWNQAKKSFRIKFDKKQKPLGMSSGKNWNLIASAQAGSMTACPIASRISEMVKTDGANHYIPVELYINGNYQGAYCLTEKVGFAGNSINLTDETNAALLELDSYGYDFMSEGKFNGLGMPVTVHNPDFSDSTEVTNLTKDTVKHSFNRFTQALAAGNDLSAFVDFPSTARYLMVNDFIVNYEIMHPKSTYCYNPDILADSLYHFGPTWDFDWGFGYETSFQKGKRQYFQDDATVDFFGTSMNKLERRDFIKRLRYSGEEMNKQYYRVWHNFINNHLDALLEYCTDYYNVAKKSFTHDNTKWYTNSNYATITQNSINWLRTRANHIYNFLSNTLGYADKNYLDTAIDEVNAIVPNTVYEGIYDLQGRRYTDLESLPAGIYIVNGKKVVKTASHNE